MKTMIVIQCDGSEYWFGVLLLQGGRAIDYRMKTLSDAETRYAQIEKEMFTVLFVLSQSNV